MGNKMRWRYGDTKPVVAAVDSATVIEIGDLLYLDTDDAKPASMQADQGSEQTNQQLFTTKFLGVAQQASRAGDTKPIRVATAGVFEFDCIASAWELGDVVGVDGDVAGTKLLNQQVDGVGSVTYGIGKVCRRSDAEVTTVLVAIESTVMEVVRT